MSPTGKPGRVQKAMLITLPDALREETDEVAEKLHISRSEFIRNALKREISLSRARLRKQGAST